MNKIFLIVKKNLSILVKSRLWMLVVIIAPLLVIFLTGIAFDNLNAYRINIGVYSPTYTPLTNSFISKLNTDQFRTIKARTEEECIDDVKIGLSNTCIIFPPNLKLGTENNDITIFIDYSKLNLAWIVRDQLFSRVEERSTEITKELTENILSKLLITRDEVSKDIALVALIKENEEGTSKKAAETFNLVSINDTVVLNSSIVDRLDSKIRSVKASNDKAIEEALKNIDFAESIVKSSEFESDDKNGYLDAIKKQRSAIRGEQTYIERFFDPSYAGSINNAVEDLRFRVDIIGKVISESKDNLFEINELTASNNKLLRKVDFSMANVERELESIDKLSAKDIATPVVTDIKPLTSYNTYLNFIFPTLIAMAIMLAALLLSTIVVVMEINSLAFFRNSISPTSSIIFFFTSYLTNLSVVGLQVIIILIISMLFFFSQVVSNIFTTLAVSFFIASFFIVLGMGIGYLFKTEQMSILAATFAASILLFLSNILLPIENMPQFFAEIAQFNPFIASVSLLRKSLLFQQSLLAMWNEILVLILFTFVLLIIFASVYWINRKKRVRKAK